VSSVVRGYGELDRNDIGCCRHLASVGLTTREKYLCFPTEAYGNDGCTKTVKWACLRHNKEFFGNSYTRLGTREEHLWIPD